VASTAHLVVIGGGFGGLYAAREAARAGLRVTVIDRKNHHTFQPLLYQVASAVLSPADIASPIRAVLRRYRNVTVLLEEARGFDLQRRVVLLTTGELAYDYLIVAAGATHSYFGHDEWAPFAPGLKTIEDALEMRRRVLLAYELAERKALEKSGSGLGAAAPATTVTFVVIGAGPTGVELAGALADIARYALAHDFRSIDPRRTRVLLLEGGPRVLPSYPEDLSRSAAEQLQRLGVEVQTGRQVTRIEPRRVWVGNESIEADVVLWAAGVAASPLGRALGVPVDRAGRVLVQPDLGVPGHPEVFVIGDLAAFAIGYGKILPGVAPVAIQQGKWSARNVLRRTRGEATTVFRYRDKGSLATIGRAAAVAQFGKLHISGVVAWLMWLFVHILYLIGFRNRFIVVSEWAWAYLTRRVGIRLITGSSELPSE
jgi:NADH dehydrogenase